MGSKPAVAPRLSPFQGAEFDVLMSPPGPLRLDELGVVEADRSRMPPRKVEAFRKRDLGRFPHLVEACQPP